MTDFVKVEYYNSTIALADGTFQYRIQASVTDIGELPHAALFVYQYTDTVDATQDTFVRVATPYDLENIPIGREAALTAGITYYLSSVLVRTYSDLNTAVQAKDAVKSRINDSVNAWYDYNTDFTGSVDIFHPTADPTYEVQLQDAYYEARTAQATAETAYIAADTAVATAKTAADTQTTVVSTYKSLLDQITLAIQYWGTFRNAVGTVNGGSGFAANTKTYQVTVKTMLTEIDPSDPQYLTYEAAIAAQDAEILTQSGNEYSIAQTDSVLNAMYLTLSSSYATAQANAVRLNNTYSSAVIAKKEAEATLASATSATAAALAAAVAICPTFVPTPP